MQETSYNFKQGIKNFAEQIFLLGGGKLRSDFDHLMYYVSCFDKQHGAAIF